MTVAAFKNNSHRGETTIRDGHRRKAHAPVNRLSAPGRRAMIDFAGPFAHKPANVRTAASGDGLPLSRRSPMAQTCTNEKAARSGG